MANITVLENDLVIFQFRRPKSVNWILSHGLLHLGANPMLLRKWSPGIVPKSFIFNYVLVWITLGHIPMKLWMDEGLAVVASVVGKPLAFDMAIRERRGMSYVCVNVYVLNYLEILLCLLRLLIVLEGRTLVYLLFMNENLVNVILVMLLVSLLEIVLDM